MRKFFAVASAAAVLFAWSGSAWAGTTVDVIFRGTGTGNVSLTPGATETVVDLVMTTTDELVVAGFSVQFDTSNGLQVTQAIEWVGIEIPVGKTTEGFGPFVRGDAVTGSGKFTADLGTINSTGLITNSGFEGVTESLPLVVGTPPGTYNMGTIIWDLSGASGTSSVAAFVNPGFDSFGAFNGTDLTGQVVFNGGAITIIPEPGTAALLGLGLAGLMVASRRRSG